jgi:hypothetical protein
METGRIGVPVPDAEAWARATGAPGMAPALGELALHALTEALSFRSRGPLAERLPRQQREIRDLELAAGVVRQYHPTLLPGHAQTVDYIRLVLRASFPDAASDFAERIEAQLERQQLLHDPTRRWEFVVPEAAMRWHFGRPQVQLGALDRLRQMAAMSNVWVGVLDLARGTGAWHSHGFNLYDDMVDGDAVVHVPLLATLHNTSDAADVDRYRQAFARLREASLTGDDAMALVGRVMDDLGAQPRPGNADHC